VSSIVSVGEQHLLGSRVVSAEPQNKPIWLQRIVRLLIKFLPVSGSLRPPKWADPSTSRSQDERRPLKLQSIQLVGGWNATGTTSSFSLPALAVAQATKDHLAVSPTPLTRQLPRLLNRLLALNHRSGNPWMLRFMDKLRALFSNC